MIRAVLRERGGAEMPAAARLGLSVVRYSWMAVGGPDEAEVAVRTRVKDLWELACLLGCPLELYNSRGDPVWWGYVGGLRYPGGEWEAAVDLDGLANAVAVVYRMPGSPGEARQTGWLADPDSQALYGIKELQVDLGEATEAQALACRAAVLEERKQPAGRLARRELVPGEVSAWLFGKGWWHTTGWRYYAQPLGLEENDVPAGGSLRLGDAAERRQARQAFALGTVEGWTVRWVALRLRAEGSPGEAVIASLLAPDGSTLAAASFAAEALGGSAWVEAEFTPAVALSPGVSYALRLEKAGLAWDPLNFYRFGVDPGLSYPRGALMISDGETWYPPVPDARLIFKLTGAEDSAAQLGRILAPDCGGQFFSALDLPPASGIAAPLWRGALPLRSARQEAEGLLRQGASGGRRYLCRVTASRRLEVWEAPRAGECDYHLPAGHHPFTALGMLREDGVGARGRLLDPYGVPLAEGLCPVGVWVRPGEIDPGLGGEGLATPKRQAPDPGRIWVERSSYEARSGKVVWGEGL